MAVLLHPLLVASRNRNVRARVCVVTYTRTRPIGNKEHIKMQAFARRAALPPT